MACLPACRTEKLTIEPASAQFELGLGLSLAIKTTKVCISNRIYLNYTYFFKKKRNILNLRKGKVFNTTDNEVGYVEEITINNSRKFNCKSCMKRFRFGQNMRQGENYWDRGLSECAKVVGWHLWNISGHSFAITNVPKKKINEKDSGFL